MLTRNTNTLTMSNRGDKIIITQWNGDKMVGQVEVPACDFPTLILVAKGKN